MKDSSIARDEEMFGNDFVDHFGGTREHEVRLWNQAVTNWEGRCISEMHVLYADSLLSIQWNAISS